MLIKEAGLGDLVRKRVSHKELAKAAGRVFSWIACVSRGRGISVQQALESKYPAQCAYCGQIPCSCDDANRQDVSLPSVANHIGPRSLRGWQHHLHEMYGANNTHPDKGVWFALFRMMDETNEIMMLEMNKDVDNLGVNDFQRKYELEIADTTAWLIATSSLVAVDLQSAVLENYGNGCAKCRSAPCRCGPHYFSADSEPVGLSK